MTEDTFGLPALGLIVHGDEVVMDDDWFPLNDAARAAGPNPRVRLEPGAGEILAGYAEHWPNP